MKEAYFAIVGDIFAVEVFIETEDVMTVFQDLPAILPVNGAYSHLRDYFMLVLIRLEVQRNPCTFLLVPEISNTFENIAAPCEDTVRVLEALIVLLNLLTGVNSKIVYYTTNCAPLLPSSAHHPSHI